jgi:hypothetical protein
VGQAVADGSDTYRLRLWVRVLVGIIAGEVRGRSEGRGQRGWRLNGERWLEGRSDHGGTRGGPRARSCTTHHALGRSCSKGEV